MVERVDPAKTGVKAGRVVGLLTGALAALSVLHTRQSVYAGVEPMLAALGVGGIPVAALFWGNVALAATARYATGYVVGSLVGVLYDWLDRPSPAILAVVVLFVGCADGVLMALETRSVLFGAGFVLAWLLYVPVFVWLFDADRADAAAHTRRARRL
ncbi:MAG: hypothetical protein ABEJ68_05325 [Halobacteriaceae archaeon]